MSIFIPQTLQDVWHCEICNRKPGRGFGMLFRWSVQTISCTSYQIFLPYCFVSFIV